MRLWDVLRKMSGKITSPEKPILVETLSTPSIEDQFIDKVVTLLEANSFREPCRIAKGHVIYNDTCSIEITTYRSDPCYEYVMGEARYYTEKRNDRVNRLLENKLVEESRELKDRQLAKMQEALAKFNT